MLFRNMISLICKSPQNICNQKLDSLLTLILEHLLKIYKNKKKLIPIMALGLYI